MKDSRIPEVRNIIEPLVNNDNYRFTKVMINNNILTFSVDDTILYITELNTIGEETSPIVFTYSDIVDLEETEYVMNYNILNEIMYNYNIYSNSSLGYPVVYSDAEMRNNEEFEKLISLKAEDGIQFFKLRGTDGKPISIPMFSGLLSINKQDRIGLTITDLLDDHLLVHWILYKKKFNRNIHMYYRILKLYKEI